MYVGETKYFDLIPVSQVPLTGYAAEYQIVSMGNVVKTATVNNTGERLEVRVTTADLQPLTYDLRVVLTDTIDGFTSVIFRERLELTK